MTHFCKKLKTWKKGIPQSFHSDQKKMDAARQTIFRREESPFHKINQTKNQVSLFQHRRCCIIVEIFTPVSPNIVDVA